MVDKRLMAAVPEARRHVAICVVAQLCALAANVAMMFAVGVLLASWIEGGSAAPRPAATCAVMAAAAAIRFGSSIVQARSACEASRCVKSRLRGLLLDKLASLGTSYKASSSTSEVVQLAGEGVEQLEMYFSSYLPQLVYAMGASIVLFIAIGCMNMPAALILLACIPLIPLSIVAVQRWAKKLLGRYWTQYTEMGDSFLENLQGLTTLKVYGADEVRHKMMNEEAERFRRVTMRVLIMQLNSISVMDLVAYGGAAAGMLVALTCFAHGALGLAQCLTIMLLAADFFIPMRQLGSFFHVALNGAAASEKIFALLNAPKTRRGTVDFPQGSAIRARDVELSYELDCPVLKGVSLHVEPGETCALVGESGSGKSTLAALLCGLLSPSAGEVRYGDVPVCNIVPEQLAKRVTYVGHQSRLFAGTVRSNLLMADPDANDEALWRVLDDVRLAGFVRENGGLDMPLDEAAGNLSGGQRQRLSIARALLHDSEMYIFDEATSNIDMESEDAIMGAIRAMASTKTMLIISHRLQNVAHADRIYVLEDGSIAQAGAHRELLREDGPYRRMWDAQRELELAE